jgi:hypothetical protein
LHAASLTVIIDATDNVTFSIATAYYEINVDVALAVAIDDVVY